MLHIEKLIISGIFEIMHHCLGLPIFGCIPIFTVILASMIVDNLPCRSG